MRPPLSSQRLRPRGSVVWRGMEMPEVSKAEACRGRGMERLWSMARLGDAGGERGFKSEGRSDIERDELWHRGMLWPGRGEYFDSDTSRRQPLPPQVPDHHVVPVPIRECTHAGILLLLLWIISCLYAVCVWTPAATWSALWRHFALLAVTAGRCHSSVAVVAADAHLQECKWLWSI